MSEIIEDKKSAGVRNRRVHMANERTFLAWIRTSIGIMAFGFVVEKFALFIKQMSIVLGKSNIESFASFSWIFGNRWNIPCRSWHVDGPTCICQVQEGQETNRRGYTSTVIDT
jgi:Domain of unknown function (DUF202)